MYSKERSTTRFYTRVCDSSVGCVYETVTERSLNAPEHAEKAKVADEKRRGLPGKPGACEIANAADSGAIHDLPATCQECCVRRADGV